MRGCRSTAGLLAIAGCLSLSAPRPGAPAEAVATAVSAATAPVIRVDPRSFDFGRTLGGKTLRKAFVLRNTGVSELVVVRVETSCHCTVSELGSPRLAPGRSTTLTLTLDTTGLRGPVERRALVRSNDPRTPLVELTLRTTVEAPAGPPGRR